MHSRGGTVSAASLAPLWGEQAKPGLRSSSMIWIWIPAVGWGRPRSRAPMPARASIRARATIRFHDSSSCSNRVCISCFDLLHTAAAAASPERSVLRGQSKATATGTRLQPCRARGLSYELLERLLACRFHFDGDGRHGAAMRCGERTHTKGRHGTKQVASTSSRVHSLTLGRI